MLAGSLASARDASTPGLSATEFKPTAKGIDLKHEDTVVFLGDSITHQCLYTQYLETFFYTRYPKRRLHFHNAGVGGDRAADALARFDEDVARFKPMYVTVLLGMNDGRSTNFNSAAFEAYERDMLELIARIRKLGARPVLLSPTMFDARAARMGRRGPQEPRDTHYNAVLSYYGEWLREQASVNGFTFVDLHDALNDLTWKERLKNPRFTLIDDAVHPGPGGQLLMACTILAEAMAKSPTVTVISRPSSDGKRAFTATGCTVDEITTTAQTVSFRSTAQALPWVLPPAFESATQLVQPGAKFWAERLTVAGLKPGRYSLRVDGALVGTFSHLELGLGLKLDDAPTPSHQQALAIALLNQEKNEKAVKPLRDLWRELKLKHSELAKAESNQAADLPARKQSFTDWHSDFSLKEAKLRELVADYEARIYTANQPRPHLYDISFISPASRP